MRRLPIWTGGGFWRVAAAVTCFGLAGRAEPAAPRQAAQAGVGACPTGARGAIADAACELARAIGTLDGTVMVAAGAAASDRLVSRPGDLAARIARSVAAAMGAALPPPSGAVTLAEARAHASGARVLVFVSTEISGGRVRFTADAYEAAQGFWDRVRSHAPRSLAHAFAERRVDGEIGSFLPAVPLVSSHVDKAVGPSDVVALACGDVDADGSLDLVAVGRRRIEIGRIRAGRFTSLGEATWPALSPVAPSPLREPIASVVVASGEHVDVGITDRQIGVRLSPTLAALGVLDQPLPWLGVGCLTRAGLALGAPRPCTSGEPAALTVGALADIDAVSGTRVVTGDGQSHAVVAWRERATGAAVVADDTGRSVRVPGAGAQIAVGDLDFDGVPEIVSGADTRTAPSDVLTVRSWSKEGDLRERYRLPVPEGIKAVAVCPAEDARAAAIVVATGGSLWVVR